ncbi:MAG: response regulator transcription factor [Thermoleophilia bacterium]|nr:response regulator transcription factor [Thermoleophilia bacterium]
MSDQGSKVRTLIVDDVASVRRDLRLLLEIAGGFQVVGEASDGGEAVELAGALLPDVVVMDLAMPVLDGFQAAARIKSGTSACRIVALTVHGAEAVRRQADAVGFDAYVVKGAPLMELLEAISPRRNQNPSDTGGLS